MSKCVGSQSSHRYGSKDFANGRTGHDFPKKLRKDHTGSPEWRATSELQLWRYVLKKRSEERRSRRIINLPRTFPIRATAASLSTRNSPSSLPGGGSGRIPTTARAMNKNTRATAQPAPPRSRRVAPRTISAPQPVQTDACSGTAVWQ